MTTKPDPILELKEDHKKVRDFLLDFIDAVDRLDAQKALEIMISLDKLGGPHFRFEEETLYPALKKFFGEDYLDHLLKAHDRVIRAAKEIVEILGKGSITRDEAEKLKKIVRQNILPHPIECNGLPLFAEKLSSEDLDKIAENLAEARKADVPLLEWAETIRQKRT
jgi:DNA-binding PadR family transcriptional regulator